MDADTGNWLCAVFPDGCNPAATSAASLTLDTSAPTITCPGNQTVPATSASGALVSFTVGASDNCGSASTQCKVGSAVITSPYTFPVGTTTVDCTATNAASITAACSFTVTVTSLGADLSVTQSANPSPVVTGTNLTYTVVVTNNGPQAAQGVVLTDPLPAGTSFVSANRSASFGILSTPKGKSTMVSWSIPALASGQSVTLTVVVKVSAKAGPTISNTATVSSSTADPNSGNNSSTVPAPVIARR